ncbi:Diuretic hormone 45 [Eumeta japonica]|uniref:Diuretic hormone 45 n=1 Tax=Eumeta variegata TaxID=151549 RepID=A0A4C1UAQ5_EUMVA|nr:Diuretic hormone 45 [Eumeta japonica]
MRRRLRSFSVNPAVEVLQRTAHSSYFQHLANNNRDFLNQIGKRADLIQIKRVSRRVGVTKLACAGKDASGRAKRRMPSLSIDLPMAVLREKLSLEKERQHHALKAAANRNYLNRIGKRDSRSKKTTKVGLRPPASRVLYHEKNDRKFGIALSLNERGIVILITELKNNESRINGVALWNGMRAGVSRPKRKMPSLSINNPMEVLRQRLLQEVARKQMREASQRQAAANRLFLKDVGKRAIPLKNRRLRTHGRLAETEARLITLLRYRDAEMQDSNVDKYCNPIRMIRASSPRCVNDDSSGAGAILRYPN